MSRKKKTDVHVNGNGEANGTTAVADPPPHVAPIEVRPEPELQGPPPPPTDDRKKPIVTFRLNSDRSTSLSLSVWCNTMKNTVTGDEYEQLSVTFQRRYLDRNEQWQTGGSWRVHDLPVLLFLLEKAHSFCLNRRCDDSSLPF